MDKTTKDILAQILNSYNEPSLLLEGSDIIMAYGISGDEALLIKDNVLEKTRKKTALGITSFSLMLEEQEYVVFVNTIVLEEAEYKHLVLEKTETNETEKSEKNEFEAIINSIPGQIFKLSKKSNDKIILSFFHGNLIDDMGLSAEVHNGLELEEIFDKLKVSSDYLDYYYTAFEGQSSRHELSLSSYFLEIYLSPFKFNSAGKIIDVLGIVEDITAKVKYRQSLEDSEKRFRLLFANENISKLLVDVETQQIIDANRSAINLFGYGEKLKGMNIYELNTALKDRLPELLNNLDNFVDNKFIDRVLTPSGNEIFIEIYITALNFSDKTIAKATIIDVTERIEAEAQVKNYIDEIENRNIEIHNRNEEIQAINEELRTTTEDLEYTLRDLNKSNENLKAIFNSSFDAILILDKEMNIVDLNDRALKYFLMSREELINTSAMNLISPENKNIFVKLKQEIDDQGVSQHVIKNNRFNNKIQFAEVRAAKFEFESRDNYIIMIRNVTEITLANKNLHQSNDRLQFLIKHNPNVIYTLDPVTMQLTYITENIYDQMGYHPNDIIGKVINSVQFVHEEDIPVFENNISVLMNQGFSQCEYRFKDSHGHYNWILSKVTLITDENDEPKEILGTWIDITSRKFAEDELNLLNQRFEFLLKHSPAIIYVLIPFIVGFESK